MLYLNTFTVAYLYTVFKYIRQHVFNHCIKNFSGDFKHIS